MDGKNPQRPLFDRQGDQICAPIESGRAAGQSATAKRIQDTPSQLEWSFAVFPLIGDNPQQGDVNSTTQRSTLSTVPGTRTSTTVTRTTTTRSTRLAREPSADSSASHAHFSFDQLVQAYIDCRRTKRNSTSALAFEINQEAELAQLYNELLTGQYQPGKSICFVITRPKPREVWAAQFRDRIVHHLLYNEVVDRFHNSFITDSCACIPGRGTLYGIKRLEKKIRSITKNWSKPAYYLKCDVANFFVTIDKRVIARQLANKIHDPWWLSLAHQILWHDPRSNYELRGNPALLKLVPVYKRLNSQPPERGLPIGNLSSQFFANIYLNESDQFIKHRIRAKHYIRYVDDMVILHESAQWLNAALQQINTFLPEQLGIELNPKKTIIQPINRGVDFVGQVIKPWRRTVRRRTVHQAINKVLSQPKADIMQTANSYFGLLRQASHSHGDRLKLTKAILRRGKAVKADLTKTYS